MISLFMYAEKLEEKMLNNQQIPQNRFLGSNIGSFGLRRKTNL